MQAIKPKLSVFSIKIPLQMLTHLHDLIVCPPSFFVMAAASLFVWVGYEFLVHLIFRICIATRRIRTLRSFRFSVWPHFAVLRDDRYIGKMWFIKQSRWCIFSISFFVMLIGDMRAACLHLPSEFALAGAFITVAGLLSAWLGFIEAGRIQNTWGNVISSFAEEEKDLYDHVSQVVKNNNDSEATSIISSTLLLERKKYLLIEKMQKPLSDAQKRASLDSLIVSILGTFIWAYGDKFSLADIPSSFVSGLMSLFNQLSGYI